MGPLKTTIVLATHFREIQKNIKRRGRPVAAWRKKRVRNKKKNCWSEGGEGKNW